MISRQHKYAQSGLARSVSRTIISAFFSGACLVVLHSELRSRSVSLPFESEQRLLMLYTPTSGLGNSNLGLLSVAKLASLLSADFMVHWHANSTLALPVPYSELYRGAHLANEQVLTQRCTRACTFDLTQHVVASCWYSLSCASIGEIHKIFRGCSCVFVKSNMYIPRLFTDFDLRPSGINLASELLQPGLKLEEKVQNTLTLWKAEYRIRRIIGVHVRAAFIAEKTENGKFVPKNDIFQTYFLPCILAVRELYSDDTVGIFIAADSEQVRTDATEILASHSPRIVELKTPLNTFPNDFELGPHRTPVDCFGAAVELELLKQSDALIAKREKHFDSTYSSTAMLLSECSARNGCFALSGATKECARISTTQVVAGIRTKQLAECSKINTSEKCSQAISNA